MAAGIPARSLGRTGRQVTLVGLGGEGILRTHGMADRARAVIDEAVGQGITYFDSARAYDGSEDYLGRYWADHPADRAQVFQTSKTASRDAEGGRADLSRSITRLNTDHLDLWQIHDLRTWDEIREMEASGGALDAFLAARREGSVRSIGVTGHHDPEILTHAVEHWPVDTVLLPVNPVEGVLGGFTTSTITAAQEKGLGIIGMKVLGASHFLAPDAGITPQLLIRYALSHGVTLVIVGCSNPDEVLALATAGRDHVAMEPEEDGQAGGAVPPLRPAAGVLPRSWVRDSPVVFGVQPLSGAIGYLTWRGCDSISSYDWYALGGSAPAAWASPGEDRNFCFPPVRKPKIGLSSRRGRPRGGGTARSPLERTLTYHFGKPEHEQHELRLFSLSGIGKE